MRDRYGDYLGTIAYVRDYTAVQGIEDALRTNNGELNRLVTELDFVAKHDNLTGLLNRGSAIAAANEALIASGLSSKAFGVVLFDLDHFKSVNDSYGHLMGDEVLGALGRVLRQTARGADIIGRFGGEEFIAFLPGAELPDVAGFAERVRLAIEKAVVRVADEISIHVTLSAGAAAIPSCADSLREAIRVADDRLYAAKRAGRNRVISSDHIEARNAA
jgi:diguanylate cyclase (GGDEF)-like protein